MLNLKKIQIAWNKLTPKQILAQSVKFFGEENLALSCSFSQEDIMLLDLAQKHYPKIDVFTLDTGRLPAETYELWQEIFKKYPSLKIIPYLPDNKKLENFILKNGPNGIYRDLNIRKTCCAIRKIDGLKRAINFKKAWITGLRKEQSKDRKTLKPIEEDAFFPNIFKINPLFKFSFKQIENYTEKNNLPKNKLYKKGYKSIGCDPCSRAIKPGEDERAGRWWWEKDEKKECGLHPDFFKAKIEKPKKKKNIKAKFDSSYLDQLENESIFILREAYKKLGKIGMLWSIGKDSCVMLHLARKAFFGHLPFPLIHIDTGYKIPEMIEFRDYYARKWGLNLVVHENKAAIQAKMSPEKGRLVCCQALKADPLKQIIEKEKFQSIIAGIRRDEEGSRAKERYFSPRYKQVHWDYKDQPPEFWDQFQTDFPKDVHVRAHPLLHWTELNIWQYIKRENIPIVGLYFARNGKRYRSLGCAPCTSPIDSDAATIDEIILELENTTTSERATRAQDQEEAHAMQKLRKKGYM